MKIPVHLQRHIARTLCGSDMSNRKIGRTFKVSPNTVRAIRARLVQAGLQWETLGALDDEAFRQALGTVPASVSKRKGTPDWLYIDTELRKRDVTLELLWQEFRESQPEGVSYPQMTRLYREWQKTQRLCMRHIYRAGDIMLVDFCGRTMPITDPDTGEVSRAQVFVAVLGGSGLIFAWVVPSQKVPDWLACHSKGFEFYGGVPRQVTPDNLKSAILKHGRQHIVMNQAYAELAEHYGFVVLPARPRKPRDKGLAEVSVQIVQRGILARLRNRVFFSVSELNEAIVPLLTEINKKTTKKFPRSRWERFQEIDAPALQPLPVAEFATGDRVYDVRVGSDYLVEWEQHYYSVPYQYAHQLVDLRLTGAMLVVFFQRERIANHVRSYRPGEKTILPEHMPPHHRHQHESSVDVLLAWAQSIGPNTYEYAQRNLAERAQFANGLKTIQKLRRWSRELPSMERLESACAYALTINALPLNRLQSIVRHEADRRGKPLATPQTTLHTNLRGADYFSTSGEAI